MSQERLFQHTVKYLRAAAILSFILWSFGLDFCMLNFVFSLVGAWLIVKIEYKNEKSRISFHKMPLFAVWAVSVVYLLDWHEYWQRWPLPSVVATIVALLVENAIHKQIKSKLMGKIVFGSLAMYIIVWILIYL